MPAKIFFIAISVIALIFNPFGSNIFELPKNVLLSLIIFASLTFAALRFLTQKQSKFFISRPILIFGGMWLMSLIISTVFSIAPNLSFFGSYDRIQGLFSHLLYLSSFIIFLQLFLAKQNRKFFIISTVIVGSLVSIHAILQHFGIAVFFNGAMQEFLGRSFATFGHPNFLGQFLILPLWLALYLAKEKPSHRIPAIIASLLIFTALLFTENRASILGVIFGAALLFSLDNRLSLRLKTLLLTLLPLTFFAFIFLVAPSLRSLSTRFFLWEGSLQIFPDHPLFGSGLESFKLVFQKAATSEFLNLEQLYSIADRAHNEYLDILINQGIFGLASYISVTIGIFYLVFKNRNQTLARFLGAAFLSILVSNFFGFSLTVHWLYFGSLIALILALYQKLKPFILPKNLLTISLSGVILGIGILGIINTTNTLRADNLFKSGTGLIYQGRVMEGIEEIQTAANLNTHQSDIFFHLSDVLFLLGKEENNKEILLEAEKVLLSAENLSGRDFRYQFALGRLKSYLGDFDTAEALFANANALAPTNPIILKEWGAMYYLQGNYPKTIEKLERFLSLIPPYWQWKINLQDHTKEEKNKFRLFFKHAPDIWIVFAYLSRSYAEIGDMEKAKYYLQFVEDDEAILTIQKLLKQKGQPIN